MTLIANWLRIKIPGPVPAPTPNPDPNAPAPAPVLPLPSTGRPLLDMLLKLLAGRFTPQQRVFAANTSPLYLLTDEQLTQLIREEFSRNSGNSDQLVA